MTARKIISTIALSEFLDKLGQKEIVATAEGFKITLEVMVMEPEIRIGGF